MNVLQSIAEAADELCDPRQHVERIPYWDANRNRKHRQWVTIQRGLLAQLYESVIPGGQGQDDGARSHPASRPPLALEALSAHTAITVAAARWCWSLRIEQRETVEGNIRALVGAAGTLDGDTQHTLYAEMRTWRRQAAVLTGWETKVWQPHLPCPVVDCARLDTLRINLTAKAAMCTACRSTWDDTDGSLYVLADYIRATERTEEALRPVTEAIRHAVDQIKWSP